MTTTPSVSSSLTPAQAVAAAPVWWYLSRNISRPYRSRISSTPRSEKDGPVLPTAAQVFLTLGLDLQLLLEIFDGSPNVPLLTYGDLGGCRIDDTERWVELARLTGKTIHLVHMSDTEQFYTFTELAVYYPDGRVEQKDAKKN